MRVRFSDAGLSRLVACVGEGMLACVAARAFAASLLEQRSEAGGDDDPSLISDVLSDFRHAGLDGCGVLSF